MAMQYQQNRYHGIDYQESLQITPETSQLFIGAKDYNQLFYAKLLEFEIILAGVTSARNDFSVQRLGAPFHTVLLTVEGEGEILDESGWSPVKPHHLVILPRGGVRGFRQSSETWRFGWFLLRDGARWSSLNHPRGLVHNDCHVASIFDGLNLLCREVDLDNKDGVSNPFALGALSLIIGMLSQSISHALELTKIERQLLQVIDDVKKEKYPDWQVDTLASKMRVSSGYLHKLCITYLNVSPSQLLLNIRMDRALHMLLAGYGNVGEVATELGYREMASFSRRFVKHFGYKPSDVIPKDKACK